MSRLLEAHSTRGLAAAVAGSLAALLLVGTAPAAAGDWLPPFDLADPGASIPVDEPLAAIAPNGDATVVWLEERPCANGSCDEIQVMTRQVRADGSLGRVRQLTPDNWDFGTADDADQPRLAVDGAGRALVAWLRPDVDGEARVEVVMLDPTGSRLGAVQQISPDGQNIESVGVGTNDAGQGVVAWSNDGGVEVRRFDATGPAPATTTLRPEADGHIPARPVVAVDPTGAATVAWSDLDVSFFPGSVTIEARRLGATDAVGTLHELDSWPELSTEGVAIDVHPASGTATILWSHFPPTGFVPDSVKAARITAADALMPFATPLASNEAGNPDVAVAPDGHALAVFDMRVQPTSATKNVVGRRIDADGTLSGLLFISDNNIDALDPQVDIAPDGTAFVGWHEDFPERNVMAARIPAGGSREDPEPLAVDELAVASAAVVADRDGSAVVAFIRNGSGDAVGAMHFDGEPPVISAFALPGSAFVGQELLFGALVDDELSPLSTLAWSFGDGASGANPLMSHTFSQPGTFPIALHVGDAAGNDATRTGSTVISAVPQPPPPPGGSTSRPATPTFSLRGLPARVPRRTLLRRGLAVQLTAEATTAFSIELLGRLRGARLAGAGDLVLAEQRLGAATGTRTARLRVSRALRRLVRRGARLQVRITATDADGGTAALTRSVRVR